MRGPLQPVEVPTRAFTAAGEEWIAAEVGRSASGSGRDPSAPLLLLTFARAAHPESPMLEILVPGRALEALADAELEQLLGRARPPRAARERQEVFPDTRRKGGRGL